jgi:segregation and condensation protein B
MSIARHGGAVVSTGRHENAQHFRAKMHCMPIDILIEGLLFYKSAPQKKTTVCGLLGITDTELQAALATLRQRISSGAMRLIETEHDIALATAPELAPVIEALRKDELKADIGKAGAETLAIILYREPVTRAEIDRIRGVNSSFILRNLLVRGLIVREEGSGRTPVFRTTPELLGTLGITHRHELPQFAAIMNELEKFETATQAPV